MDKAIELLGQLAEKLGQTVEALWPHAVRYVVVDAATDIAFALVVLVGTWIAARKVVAWVKEEDPYEGGAIVFAAYLTGAVVTVATLASIFSALQIVIEPVGYLVANALGVVSK